MAKKIIYCPRCGKKVSANEDDKKLFCMHCGNSIDIVIPEEDESLEMNAVESGAEKEPSPLAESSVSTAWGTVRVPVDAVPPKDESEKAKPDVPNPFAAMMQTQRELAAEQIKKAEEQAAEQRKRENMSASKCGVLHSEATEEEKQAQKKLTFGGYLKNEWGLTNAFGILFIISFVLFAIGVIFLSAVKGTLILGLICSLGIIGAIFFFILRGFFPRRCGKCKTDLNIADVEYERIKTETVDKGKMKATFRFKVKCPKCGTYKVFERTVFETDGRYDIRSAAGRKMWENGNDDQATWKEKIFAIGMFSLFALAGLICLIIGIVGLVNRVETEVPDDFYGTYIVTSVPSESYNYMLEEDNFSITLNASKAIISGSAATAQGYAGEYDYEYVFAETVSAHIDNPRYTTKDVITIYIDSSNDSLLPLYIISQSPTYTFELKNGIVLKNKSTLSAEGNSGAAINSGSMSNGQNSTLNGGGSGSQGTNGGGSANNGSTNNNNGSSTNNQNNTPTPSIEKYNGEYGNTTIQIGGQISDFYSGLFYIEIEDEMLYLIVDGSHIPFPVIVEKEDFVLYGFDNSLSAEYAVFNTDVSADIVFYLLSDGGVKMKVEEWPWDDALSGEKVELDFKKASEAFTIYSITAAYREASKNYSYLYDITEEQSECNQRVGELIFLFEDGECCFLPNKTDVFNWTKSGDAYFFLKENDSICNGVYRYGGLSLNFESSDSEYVYYLTLTRD